MEPLFAQTDEGWTPRDKRERREETDRSWKQYAEKPSGGFIGISASIILLVWWVRSEGILSPLAFRCWFALQEMKHRRDAHGRAQKRKAQAAGKRAPDLAPGKFGVRELAKFFGEDADKNRLRKAVGELLSLGLVNGSSDSLTFIESPDQLKHDELDGYWDLIRRAGKTVKRGQAVPIPRRMVQRLARGESGETGRGFLATVLGVCLRCLYRRKVDGTWQCVSGGLVSTKWIAEVFGVSQASVKHKLAHLAKIGFITRQKTYHWAQQHHGKRTVVELTWGDTESSEESGGGDESGENVSVSTPLAGQNEPVSTPPNKPRTLRTSEELKNQEPDETRTPGVCTSDTSEKDTPNVRDVRREDLTDINRLLILFSLMIPDGTERDRINFVSAADYGLRKEQNEKARDAVRVFLWVVRNEHWGRIDGAAEQSALERLKAVDRKRWGYDELDQQPRARQNIRPREISSDAQVVRKLRNHFKSGGDLFVVLNRHMRQLKRETWSRDRWDVAVEELDAWIGDGQFRN